MTMKNHKSRWKRPLALLLCFMLLATSAAALDSRTAFADTGEIKELNDKYELLEKEQKSLQSKIDQAKSDKEKQLAIKDKTTKEIQILESQIAVLREKIVVMEQNIVAKETEIEGLNGDIDQNLALFKKRMRAMYMSNTSTTLGLVLGAESYGDYLARGETVKRVAQHDQALIADLTSKKENVESIKADLDAQRTDLDAAKAAVESKNRELDGRLATTVSQIQDIDQMEKEFLVNKVELQKQMDEVQAELDDIYAQMEMLDEDFVGGVFTLPVPGYSKISSYYGLRWGGRNNHTGIDFTGTNVHGKPVVAANGGVVSLTQETYVTGRGYGRYMIVDHGGGYTTIYAHLSEISVEKGARVRKGEIIGKVGSTGWSTGPHLHFEVRINGVHKNPLNFLRV